MYGCEVMESRVCLDFFGRTLYILAMQEESLIRIGELSRRSGVSPEVLRAWERRYQLFAPRRSEGGFRLYSGSDVARINAMKRLISEGVTASEAARQVRIEPTPEASIVASLVPPPLLDQRLAEFKAALLSFNESESHAVIDRLLLELDTETVMRHLFLPALQEIGQLWQQGRLTVAQEHFASNLIRRRLSGFARGWDEGTGPSALLACPPEEDHDIPLLMFGIALANRGWRIIYLGARTPIDDLVQTVRQTAPACVILASQNSQAFTAVAAPLHNIANDIRIAIGGAGATQEVAAACGATLLSGDPIAAAIGMSRGFSSPAKSPSSRSRDMRT